MDISKATLYNWNRMQSDTSSKLQRGANKSRSAKRIYPVEYIANKECLKLADTVRSICDTHNIARVDAIFSLAVKFLEQHGINSKQHVKDVLQSYSCKLYAELFALTLPTDEQDILEFIYQCLLNEGEKNVSGSYYTPQGIVREMVGGFDLKSDRLFLDPCCGSGAFLLTVNAANPTQLWGCDKDPVAVLIAKINLLCKFRKDEFVPQIYCCDFLADKELFSNKKFDFIATNPPWGAEKNSKRPGTKSDSFALFFKKAKTLLHEHGVLDFLFPESVLYIKNHAPLRKFILTECSLEQILLHRGSFSGVMTKYVSVRINCGKGSSHFKLHDGSETRSIATENILQNRDFVFFFANETDLNILEKLKSLKCFYLQPSMFSLGIVTGDNKRFVSDTRRSGMEAVFTGKDVQPYVMKTPKKYLLHAPEKFQQTAKNECYRAPEKLIYKFISKHPVFAYDNTQTLVLNSANVVTPNFSCMSIKTVLAFLNSNFLKYIYTLKFQDIKVLKGNLMALPLPEIDSNTDLEITSLANRIISGDSSCEPILQKKIYRCYNISLKEEAYIERYLQK